MKKSMNQLDRHQHIYAIVNPAAGNADVEGVEGALEELCRQKEWSHEVYTTTGEEDLAEVAQAACRDGATLILAAGGDGTVAGVVNGLVRAQAHLAVVPLGTGNGLARAMGVPLDVQEAVSLLGEDHRLQDIDVMQVGDRYFTLNVSVGISARAMRETDSEEKKKKGLLAYVETIVNDLAEENETTLFELEIDGEPVEVEAMEVLVSNGRILEQSPILFGPRQSFNDGKLEVNILAANEAAEFVRLAWDLLLNPEERNQDLHDLAVREHVRISAPAESPEVQADGEIIGRLPVDVRVKPRGIRMVVPPD